MKKLAGRLQVALVSAAGIFGLCWPVCAADLVYRPISPMFGGDPLNATFLSSIDKPLKTRAAASAPSAAQQAAAAASVANPTAPTVVIQPSTIPANP
jgi:hypothetical protein